MNPQTGQTHPNVELGVKKLHPDAMIPRYATEGAACFDLHSIEAGYVQAPGACTFETGLAFEIPEGHVLLVYSRSGHGFKQGVRLSNCVGVVDSDYKGSMKVRLQNDGRDGFWVNAGDRVAQAMLVPLPRVTLREVETLSESARGEGGFGSTGR
jgi:dUTP pyrophosphatase